MATPFDKKDAQELTGATDAEASDMWHQAREDARACGELDDRSAETASWRAGNEPSADTFSDSDFFTRLTGK